MSCQQRAAVSWRPAAGSRRPAARADRRRTGTTTAAAPPGWVLGVSPAGRSPGARPGQPGRGPRRPLM